MTHKLRWLLAAGLVALAASAPACSGDDTKPKEDICKGVVCAENMTCDPNDGRCKCGPGGLECVTGRCVLEPAPACVSDLCELVTCSDGQSCDPVDGLCKCGGAVCDEGQRCVNNRCVSENADRCAAVVCDAGMECDPEDGLCKCGEIICSPGERCVAPDECRRDKCLGVNCSPGTVCNEQDGLCHCGDETGPVCATGEACVGGSCTGYELCENVTCADGTICDPVDGSCRCGGLGDEFRVCEIDQVCVGEECRFGNNCTQPDGMPVDCSHKPGSSCSPENGLCVCDDDGTICPDGEVCARYGGKRQCVRKCDPIAQDCGEGFGCYLDVDQTALGFFCAPAGTGTMDAPCSSALDCEPGLHCSAWVGSGGSAGRCRAYCSRAEHPPGDPLRRCDPDGLPSECVALQGADDPDWGVCYQLR